MLNDFFSSICTFLMMSLKWEKYLDYHDDNLEDLTSNVKTYAEVILNRQRLCCSNTHTKM